MTPGLGGSGVGGALAVLSGVIDDLARALENGRADDVLVIESRLVDAIRDVRLYANGSQSTTATSSLGELAERIRDGIHRCRRMGGTVPALLSVMFPGQVGYGPAGHHPATPRVVSAMVKVI
jgi:hypothetical protein